VAKKNNIKEDVELDEEVFNWYIIKGNKEKGKVAHVGTERQLKLKIRKPTFPPNHVLAKSRKDLRIGDKWKATMGVSEEVEINEVEVDLAYGGFVQGQLKRKGIDARFWKGRLYVSKKEIKKAKEILKQDPNIDKIPAIIGEEIELDEMPNRANMEKINSLLKDYAG
ncbi:MAG: hypothetical protein QGI89_05665, partial [Candidatus Woesearchaeota archaeon]|nr:hypothetical protein [Candidatus Woesearchaeota archaeon]